MPSHVSGLMWFRRDLRAEDNAALHHALRWAQQNDATMACVFVFDTALLHRLPKDDRRIAFIHAALQDLDEQLQALSQGQARLIVLHGKAVDDIVQLAAQRRVQKVFINHDDEPEALRRDDQVRQALHLLGIGFSSHKDHVIFERHEVLAPSNKPYTVFTPYKNAWLKHLKSLPTGALDPYPIAPYAQVLQRQDGSRTRTDPHIPEGLPSLADIGFADSRIDLLKIPTGTAGARKMLADFLLRMHRYHETRDFPSLKAPSYLSAHLRFGTVSIRALVRQAFAQSTQGCEGAATWLSELIWRDFFFQILYHFPHVVDKSFKPEYDRIVWEEGARAEAHFEAWCNAKTGYPLVDAAMRQLNESGYMHNRLRMIVASFLSKDLGINWRRGEAYFAAKLLDFDLAANNGGWQWAASSGCDAQPYFRIFNPVHQSEKFDPTGKFIRRYVPELSALQDQAIHAPWRYPEQTCLTNYPAPIIEHAAARARTLVRYSVVKRETDRLIDT